MTVKAASRINGVLRNVRMCAWCLGRQYASSSTDIESTGLLMAKRLGLVPSEDCELCGSAFERRKEVMNRIVNELARFEFETFQTGITLPNDSVEKEDEIRSKLKLSSGISLKKGLAAMFRQELAKRIHKKPALRNPDITVRISLPEAVFEVESKPVIVYVEYLKLARGVSIRAIPCWKCSGGGCAECGGTGVDRQDRSVETELTRVFLAAFQGRKVKISWSGIEDDSSLLLGGGRPAYVEIVAPIKRVSGLMSLNMTPTVDVQLTRAEIAPLERERIEELVKEVLVMADFECELTLADAKSLELAFKGRDLTVLGDKRGRRKRVHSLMVTTSGKGARLHFILDNGASIRQILAVKSGSDGDLGKVQPSFADVMPTNRILSAESDVVRFRRVDY